MKGAGFLLAVLVVFAVWTRVAPTGLSFATSDRDVIDASDFELLLSMDKTEYELGEKPKCSVKLINRSNKRVMLIRPLDGSTRGRFPQFMWTYTVPEDALPRQPWLGCGNTNPITPGDFFTLGAGQSVELGTSWGAIASNELDRGPGEYTVQVIYSTDQSDVRGWLGGPLGDKESLRLANYIDPLLSQVPRFSVTSNAVTIRFNPLGDIAHVLRNGTRNQVLVAVRTTQWADRDSEIADALVDALIRLKPTQPSFDYEYARLAILIFDHLHYCAGPEEMDRLWEFVLESLEETGGETSLVRVKETALALLHLMVSPQMPNHVERVAYLLTDQTFQTAPFSRTSPPIQADEDSFALLDLLPAEERNAVLDRIEVNNKTHHRTSVYRLIEDARARATFASQR